MNEIKVSYSGSSALAVLVENQAGQWWNKTSQVFETPVAANVASYAAAPFSQVLTSFEYMANFPTPIVTAGKYRTVVYAQAGASLAMSDLSGTLVGSGIVEWDGTKEISNAVSFTGIASQESAQLSAEATTTALAAVASSVAAIPAGVWTTPARTITGGSVTLPTEFLSASEQAALNGEATASTVAAIQAAVTSNGTALTAIQATLSGMVAAILTAIKTDSLLARTWNSVLGKFTFNASTSVQTCLQDDGATSLGTNTIGTNGQTITSRV